MRYILPVETHDAIVVSSYRQRGFDADEAEAVARICRMAAWHGIKTHNAIKALELDDHYGSGRTTDPLCVPGAKIVKHPTQFAAAHRWDAGRKLGPIVAYEAMDTAMTLAQKFGVGMVSVDNAFHYIWGGGYVMEAAKKGFVAYTNCTSTTAEVVPFQGHHPTLGTNPHSWGFPTSDVVGFPIVVDWASSAIAMGRVNQYAREGQSLPPETAVDRDGTITTDPDQVAALLPFGGHKGYGLALIIELMAALIGGSLPTSRGYPDRGPSGEKDTSCFFFQVIDLRALGEGCFAFGRDRTTNLKAVIEDVLGHGNESCMLPGQPEAEAARRSEEAGGLIFTQAEIVELAAIGRDVGVVVDPDALAGYSVA